MGIHFPSDAARAEFWQVVGKPDQVKPPERDDLIAFMVRAGASHPLYAEVSSFVAGSRSVVLQDGPVGARSMGSAILYESAASVLTLRNRVGPFQDPAFFDAMVMAGRHPADPQTIIDWMLSLDSSNSALKHETEHGKEVLYLTSYSGGDDVLILKHIEGEGLFLALLPLHIPTGSIWDMHLEDLPVEPIEKISDHHWGGLYPDGSAVVFYGLDAGIPAAMRVTPVNKRRADLREILLGHHFSKFSNQNFPEPATDDEWCERIISVLTSLWEEGDVVYSEEKLFAALMTENLKATIYDAPTSQLRYLVSSIGEGDALAIQRVDLNTRTVTVALVEGDRRARFMEALRTSPEGTRAILEREDYLPIRSDRPLFGYITHPRWGIMAVKLCTGKDGNVFPQFLMHSLDPRAKDFLGKLEGQKAPPITPDDTRFAEEFILPILDAGSEASPQSLIDFVNALPDDDSRVMIRESGGSRLKFFVQQSNEAITLIRVANGQSVSVGVIANATFDARKSQGNAALTDLIYYPLQQITGNYYGLQHLQYRLILVYWDQITRLPTFASRNTVEAEIRKLRKSGKLVSQVLNKYDPLVARKWFRHFKGGPSPDAVIHLVSEGDKDQPRKYIAKKEYDGASVIRLSPSGVIEYCCVPAVDREAVRYLTLKRPNERQKSRIRAILNRLNSHFIPIEFKGEQYGLDHPLLGRIHAALEKARPGDRNLAPAALFETGLAHDRFFKLPEGFSDEVDPHAEDHLSVRQRALLERTAFWFEQLKLSDPGVLTIAGHKMVVIPSADQQGYFLMTAGKDGKPLANWVHPHSLQAPEDLRDLSLVIEGIREALRSSDRVLKGFEVQNRFLSPNSNGSFRIALKNAVPGSSSMALDFFPLTVTGGNGLAVGTNEHFVTVQGYPRQETELPLPVSELNLPLLEWMEGLASIRHPAALQFLHQKDKENLVYFKSIDGSLAGLLVDAWSHVLFVPLDPDLAADRKMIEDVEAALLTSDRLLSHKVSERLAVRETIQVNLAAGKNEEIKSGRFQGKAKVLSEPGKVALLIERDSGAREIFEFSPSEEIQRLPRAPKGEEPQIDPVAAALHSFPQRLPLPEIPIQIGRKTKLRV
ncbi:MAG: hypothetical protein Q7T11_02035, partial [Deltaproteobacteria bacterium]|nr:hypothetical protein [Deltaproteobacteria bacterium]